MADTLYLSLWYPNLRLAALPDKLVAVLGAFAAHGGEAGVYAATVWPVGWSESPIFQQVWGRSGPNAAKGVEPRVAVEAASNFSTTTTPTNSRSAGISGNWRSRKRT